MDHGNAVGQIALINKRVAESAAAPTAAGYRWKLVDHATLTANMIFIFVQARIAGCVRKYQGVERDAAAVGAAADSATRWLVRARHN